MTHSNQLNRSGFCFDPQKGFIMKRLLALAVAIAAVSMFAETNANAQGFGSGYQFGAGINSVHCGGFARGFQREQPPYFAKFPPVYYSGIVKRPYGISPYAAPAGIAPVEMSHAPAEAVTIKNPFFDKAAPVKAPAKPKSESGNKVTVVTNPYMSTVATK
jgi:hypothetical protein